MNGIEIRSVNTTDKDWIKSLVKSRQGSERVVSRGKVYNPSELLGFVAVIDGKNVGLITFSIVNNECEIVTLDSLEEGKGVGTSLIEKVMKLAKEKSCYRIWLITTNDNSKALRFYQKRGFILKALYSNALSQSRKLKPEIPQMGNDGIPLRDEIELEFRY